MPDLLHPAEGPESEDDDAQQGDDEGGDFVQAGTAEDQIEANLLVSACEEAGIPALVRAVRDSMVGKLDSPANGLAIMVRTADFERARALLSEQKAALEADPEAAARAAEAAEEQEAAEEAAKGQTPS
jgi:hypothetical protein